MKVFTVEKLGSKFEVEVGAPSILKDRGDTWGFYTEYREINLKRLKRLHMTFKIGTGVLIKISPEMIEDEILDELMNIFIENANYFYSDEPWLLPLVSIENLLLKSDEYKPTILSISFTETDL